MRIARILKLKIILPIGLLAISTLSIGESIYSIKFDYRKIEPTSVYFYRRSESEIVHLCKTGEHAGTADIAACTQRDFEKASKKLNALIATEVVEYRKDDADLRSSGYPIALPDFERAQRAWSEFRDSQCYAETYSLGLASMRYISFWDCMTRITNQRIVDLESPKD